MLVDQIVRESLVVPLTVVVRHKLLKCSTQLLFAERYDPIQAFFLDRPDEALRIRVAVRRSGR